MFSFHTPDKRFRKIEEHEDNQHPMEGFENEPLERFVDDPQNISGWSMNANETYYGAETNTPVGKDDLRGSGFHLPRRFLRSEKLIFLFSLIGLSSMLTASILAYMKWGSEDSTQGESARTGDSLQNSGFVFEQPPSSVSITTSFPTEVPLPWTPVQLPSSPPVLPLTESPTKTPTASPSTRPSIEPTATEPTYIPGNLTTSKLGLLLSEGLDAKLIAITDQNVPYDFGSWSEEIFHDQPDAGATFPDTRPENPGGWVYVSNSEVPNGEGGVGAITFNSQGDVVSYQRLLSNTNMNCGGGRTPWMTWVTCEEVEFTGLIYQVDPLGIREPELLTLGSEGGRWESFAFDVRDAEIPHFFATEDHSKGCVRRFTPNQPNWDDPWSILHGKGETDFLIISPNATNNGGTYEWTTDKELAKNNAKSFYPMTEGIDVYGSQMFFVCKRIKMLFVLDLDSNTYYNQSTSNGLFDGTPDQVQRILGDSRDLAYFTEEGGVDAGVHARDNLGRFYTIFESPVYPDETTGLSFSPDGRFMYTAYQNSGLLFSIWRKDGLPFHASHLDIKYHH